jgi:beta-galactosidase GanA
VAGGPAGFTFWQYRSERVGSESNGYGLREIDGSPTERSRVADDVAKILRRHGSRLAGTKRPVARVALLYSRESDLLLRIQHMKQGLFTLAAEPGDDSHAYKRAIKAAHLLYLGNGQTVDWVIPGDQIKRYALLHVTATEVVTEDMARWLRDYVWNGGTLVVEFPFACRDEKTWVIGKRPGYGLESLLGCTEADRVVIAEGVTESAVFSGGIRIPARDWRIDLRPTFGRAIARWPDNGVAAVRHTYGQGSVYCLGASVSLAFRDTWDDPGFRVCSRILKDAGVPAPSPSIKRVWTRRRVGTDREIWFVFSVDDTIKEIRLPDRPRSIWGIGKASLKSARLVLEPGGFFVGELPQSTQLG